MSKSRSSRRAPPAPEPESSSDFQLHPALDPELSGNGGGRADEGLRDEHAPEEPLEQDHGLSGRLGTLAQTILAGHGESGRSGNGIGDGGVEGEGDVINFGEDSDQLFGEHGNPEFGQLLQAVGEHERKRTEAEAMRERSGYGLEGSQGPDGTFDSEAPAHLEDADGLLGRAEPRTSLLRDTSRVLGKRGPSRPRNFDEEVGMDPLRLKKDAHKEVERRRRATINEGYEELAALLPEGQRNSRGAKSMVLSRAADHMSSLTQRVQMQDEELGRLRNEKLTLTSELQLVNDRLGEEQARSLRFEQSWREAEDRSAAAQFELERLKTEIQELRG